MDLTIVVSTAIINITIIACAFIWYKTIRPSAPKEPKPQVANESAPKPPATAKQRLGRGGTFA